jgi:hypothetical protein
MTLLNDIVEVSAAVGSIAARGEKIDRLAACVRRRAGDGDRAEFSGAADCR